MQVERVEHIVRYAIFVASQRDDWKERELGPIHLLKFLYLADLAYAEGHDGQTYTGIEWKFHHFGPWNPEAFQALDQVIGPPFRRKDFKTKDDKDMVRWSLPLSEESLGLSLERSLELRCSLAVKRAVNTFGNDTKSLLHEVYRTQPMVDAEPGQRLVFKGIAKPTPSEDGTVSKSRHRKMRKKVLELKAKKKSSSKGWNGSDEFLDEGIEWLDDLEGSELSEASFTVEIDPSAWKIGIREKND